MADPMSAPPPPNPDLLDTASVRAISDTPALTTNNLPDPSLQELSDQARTTLGDEVLTIPDHMMVFRSNEVTVPLHLSKRRQPKVSRTRFKKRDDTPAPSTKGDGRKRFDVSPFPEDKQICKRLDFGTGSSPTTESLRCKGAIFLATTNHGSNGSSKNMEHEAEAVPIEMSLERRLVCYKSSNVDEVSPDSGDLAGNEEAIGHEEDIRLHHPWSKLEDPSNGKGVVVGEFVNLPKMSLETKVLLESPLEPCHLEESHVDLAVGDHVKPKKDNLLLLAQLDSADSLDSMVVQPLLAGGQQEDDQMVDASVIKPLPEINPHMLALVTSCPSSDDTEGAQPSVEPHCIQSPTPDLAPRLSPSPTTSHLSRNSHPSRKVGP